MQPEFARESGRELMKTALAAELGWSVARSGPRLVARRAGRRLARRLLDEAGG